MDEDATDTGEESVDNTVVYDLSEWEPDQVDTLEWALGREGVRAILRDDELTIRAEDEARVDHLIDQLFDTDDTDDTEDTDDTGDTDDRDNRGDTDNRGDAGLDDMDAIGDLFVAADRLTHRGDDPVVGAEFEEAVAALGDRPVPYGFETAVWVRITTMSSWLVDELDGSAPELIEEHAGKLRDLLRNYV
jgi:hypothetical protein